MIDPARILSDITVYSKYAKFLPNKARRETWDEICDRYMTMMQDKYPALRVEIAEKMEYVRQKKVLPSMRALQFAGPAIEKNAARIYNCAYMPVDDYRTFSEAMFLLLGGTGVGYSVQKHHVAKLPAIKKPVRKKKFLIGDSIEGWADAVKALMKAYFGLNSHRPVFDFSDIRAKGEKLITAGGKAPGPEPLKECLFQVEKILERKKDGEKLTPIQCHDILCHIANAVLAGGIRRAAMIALFSFDDDEMLTCKFGNWWELNEQRGRANNSAVLERDKITEEQFFELWKKVRLSNSGEPGMYFTNDKNWGTNPCCEIALRPYQFCNLTEVNVSDVESQYDLNARAGAAAFFGTLQAGVTDFHYLRNVWKETTEEDALIGVGMTGIGSGNVMHLDLTEAAAFVKKVNKNVAALIGINPGARTTTIKPSGTSSMVLGTSSGIHAWFAEYYKRTMRLGKNEALYTYLAINHPELVEDEFFRPNTMAVVSVPQKAPEGAILRTESAIDLLTRVKAFNLQWVKQGHRSGKNTNNVSATISVKEDEWEEVGNWMWENRATFNGLSVLPYDNGSYVQAPFEEITEEKYNELIKSLSAVDLRNVVEFDDTTSHAQEAACAGGACEI